MSIQHAAQLASQALLLALILSAPLLIVSLVVGFVVAFLQAATQIQEYTLSFVPKLIIVTLTLLALSGWMSAKLTEYIATLWDSIPTLGR